MNKRISTLRKKSLETVPHLSMERAVIVTETYKKHYGKVSIPVMRALTFKELMEKKAIYIGAGELIVGEKGDCEKSVPTFPELCCHTIEDFDIIDSREKVFYRVADSEKNIHKETILPYWHGKSIRDIIFENVSQEWKDCYKSGIFTEFMEQRAPGHTVGDGKIYTKGFKDFKKDINKAHRQLDFVNDPNAYDKGEELKAMLIAADAIIVFGKRHRDLALKLAKSETNQIRKAELEKIAKICDRVPENSPTTFHEALQMYWFVHLGVTTELNTWDSFCPGRLDQHLNPFYEKEIEAGTLTRENAKELLSLFWIKFNNQPAPPKVGVTLKESATYTDFCNINSGGLKADGTDGVNDVSYLILEVIDEMTLLQPSSNIQLSRRSPDMFIKKASSIIAKGWGQPSIFNADAVIEEMLRQGKSLEDARCGGNSGCVETGAFGKEAFILTGYFNLVKVLEITLNNGFDPISKMQLGLNIEIDKIHSLEELLNIYKKQVDHFIDIKMAGNNIIETLYMKYMPSPFLSIIIDDCISSGKDYNSGGARYNSSYIQGVGIGTLTDSFSFIKANVFDKQVVTLTKLRDITKKNFAGYEAIRLIALNKTPKYGNDDDDADMIMRQLFNVFFESVDGRPNIKGGKYRINMLPTTCHVYFGSVTGATPDGRLAFTPQSEGISPVQGSDIKGPTAVIKSASKMEHLKTGGTLLNLKLTPSLVKSDEGIDKMVSLVRSYFKLDGHHIQFNIVDKSTLENAKKNPMENKDLIVRVAGYSDYFCDLSEALQDEIISRTEHGEF